MRPAVRPSSMLSRRNSLGSPLNGLEGFLTARQAGFSNAVRNGRRGNSHAIRDADDAAFHAAIAESMKPWAYAMTDHQVKILDAMIAGFRVSPQAIQKANDDAIAAAIQESLKQSSPAQRHTVNSASAQQPRPPQASAETSEYSAEPSKPSSEPSQPSAESSKPSAEPSDTSPAPRPGTPESAPSPAGQATASSAASGAQAPNPAALEQLDIPEGPDWRQAFNMVGRVLPESVMENAKTSDGIEKMIAEIRKAKQDAREQHRKQSEKLQHELHTTEHFVDAFTALNDLTEIYLQSEVEFSILRKWLVDQRRD